jgi:hypothetical protein
MMSLSFRQQLLDWTLDIFVVMTRRFEGCALEADAGQ